MFRLVAITVTLALGLSTAFAGEARPQRTTSVASKSKLCAGAGAYSDSVVSVRDAGVPPSFAMDRIDRLQGDSSQDKAFRAFMRWIVVSVYKYDAFDAPRLRRMVEVACFESAF